MKKITISIIIIIFSTCFVFSQNIDVTFRIDMQNQTVSSSGVFVAGTFNNWTTNTNQLTDSNGDQVYEIILSLSANNGYEYKFINGNSWESDLSGSCANNFGSGPNRWLSVGSNDQVEPAYQFSSCNIVVFYGCTDSLANNYNSNATNDDGSCDYTVLGCTDLAASNYNPAANTDDGSCLYSINVVFNVNMSNESVSSNGVHIAGSFTGWTTDSIEMNDFDGDGVYTVDILLDQNQSYEYKFINGNSWGDDEILASWESCINPSSSNRTLTSDTNTTQTLPVVCFASCIDCQIYGCTDPTALNFDSTATVDDGSCSYTVVLGCTDLAASNYDPAANTDDGSCLYSINVVFNVNMSNESVSSNGVHVAGSFTGWTTDSIEMNDFDGDGVYTVDILLDQNQSYEYKFINGNSWGDDEILASWESCINPSSSNRTLTSDTNTTQTLPVVCFASCIDCQIYGCTDPTALNFDSTATLDDGSCFYSLYGCTDNSYCNYNPSATIDDGSCYNLIFDLGNDTTICSNSFLEIGVSDVYSSYEWNNQEITNSIIVSTDGTYVLQIIDSIGCTSIDSINVNVNSLPLVDIGNDQTICFKDSLLLDAGIGWTSYLWSDGSQSQFNLINDTGLVSVQVTDSFGCVGIDVIDVSVQELPTAQFTIIINQLDVTFVDESINSDYYLWDFTSDGSYADSTYGDVVFNYPNYGSFNATLFVTNECGTDSFTSQIILETSEIINNDDSFSIYLDNQNQLFVESKKCLNNFSIDILNLNGQLLKSYKYKDIISKKINIDFLKTGIHLLVISIDGDKYTKKLFIN